MLSGIVQIADVNDFINPNQSCVKPLLDKSSSSSSTKINLADCLACSGCVTSAETILIQEHSLNKHFELSKDKFSVLLFSNQAIESLSNHYTISFQKCLEIVCSILKPDLIFNIDDINLYTLNLCYEEFIQRKNSLICSECPGWICYAEKKVGSIAFDFMSKVKSPQQILSIILRKMFQKVQIKNENIYICSIMQCFDKKIESVRNKNEINCVLTPIEMQESIDKMIKENQETVPFQSLTLTSFISLINEYLSNTSQTDTILEYIKKHINPCTFSYPIYHSKENFSSNSYTEYFIYKILQDNPQFVVERNQGKNIDIKEINILTDKKEPYAKFCIAYGFRNVQNIVRNLKRKKLVYDYIELMACPGGCINGGGQIRETIPRKLLTDISNKVNTDDKYCAPFKSESFKEIEDILNQEDKNKFIQTFHQIEFSMTDLKW